MKMHISKYLLIIAVILGLASCSKEPGPDNGNGGQAVKDWTISGCVKGDDGKAIEGVVVSDGLNCVKTDKEGRYYLPADLCRARIRFCGWVKGVCSGCSSG